MGGMIAGRTASEMPGLDIAEQRAWQNFLDAALRLYGTLNRGLVDKHKLSLVDVRLLEILDNSETGAARMGDLAEQLMSLPSRVTRQIRRLEAAGLVHR
jgi:DNA-binding MarR family transcriptional regulator